MLAGERENCMMRENPKPFELYKHFKGNLYQIVTLAKDSETLEEVVVYRALYGTNEVYVRPLSMFMSEVDKTKYPDVEAEYRFEKVDANGVAVTKQALNMRSEDAPEDEVQAEALNETMQMEAATDEAMNNVEYQIDPAVLEFLEADTYEERLRILVSIQSRITDDMINTMAIATDVEVPEGPIEERYNQLKNCLVTLEKYECNRVR